MLVWMMYKIKYIHEIYLEETDIERSLIVIGGGSIQLSFIEHQIASSRPHRSRKKLCELVKSVGEQKNENRNFMNTPVILSKHGE